MWYKQFALVCILLTPYFFFFFFVTSFLFASLPVTTTHSSSTLTKNMPFHCKLAPESLNILREQHTAMKKHSNWNVNTEAQIHQVVYDEVKHQHKGTNVCLASQKTKKHISEQKRKSSEHYVLFLRCNKIGKGSSIVLFRSVRSH